MGTDNKSESAFGQLGRRGLFGQMHEQLDEMLAARDQMESLLRIVVDISSDLDLDVTLHRIITAAIGLTGARYGALGVWAPDGSLDSFLFEGIEPDLQARIGHLPVGKGILGSLLNRTEPLRVDDLTQHPDAVGFPEHHPSMRAFLGVPITIRAEVYGSLYVTDDRPGRVFSESAETVARALGAAAAVAIDNAKLFARERAITRWTIASREITSALLSEERPQEQALHLVATRARWLSDAEHVIVLTPDNSDQLAEQIDTLTVSTAVGRNNCEILVGQQVPVKGSSAGDVFRTGAPLATDKFQYPIPAFTDLGERPAIVVPLRAHNNVIGVLAAARSIDQPRFDDQDLEWMSDFASHAAMALTLAHAHEQAHELTILADRERIADDLHDHVIQRLFAAGMDLQGTISRVRSPRVIERLTRTVNSLQTTIDEIRTAIFNLQLPTHIAIGFRERIQQLIAELTDDREFDTTLSTSGPMILVEPQLADHAEAVLTEAISNAVRHSGGNELTIEVIVGNELVVNITDNGRGIPAENRRHSGLANMHRRAQLADGKCEILTPATGGTRIHWTGALTNS